MDKHQRDNKSGGKAIPILLTGLVCALPSVYLYSRNAAKIPFRDVAYFLAFSVAAGMACLLLLWLVTGKRLYLASLLTSACMALFLCFKPIVSVTDAIFPQARVRAAYLVALGVLCVLAALIMLLHHKKKEVLTVRLATAGLGIVFLMNVAGAVPGTIQRLTAATYTTARKDTAENDLPNLYYFITDEYASFEEIQKYYGYDNSAFHDFLTERGFCVSDDSYNHYANTARSMADNVNLAPVSRWESTDEELKALRNNGVIYGALEGLGYDLYQLGTIYPLPKLLEQVDGLDGGSMKTMNGETAFDVLLDFSMLRPLKTVLYWRKISAAGDMALFDYLDDSAHYKVKNNRAVFFYICSPHPPFYYGADGQQIEDENKWTDWADQSCYLGQYQYITKRLEQTISSILANDPGAVILVQSDHGLRYHTDGVTSHTFTIAQEDQRRILNALYFGGKQVDISGLSGYNTLRMVLTELGLDYPVLEEPQD